MILKEIIDMCSELNIYEKRCISDEYSEIVFYSRDTDEWSSIFTEIMGPAAKPKGEKPTSYDASLTKDYGGIFDNQTLFKKDYEGAVVIVMLWPWQGGDYTTLKMVYLEKE